jgi:hypothetical protein
LDADVILDGDGNGDGGVDLGDLDIDPASRCKVEDGVNLYVAVWSFITSFVTTSAYRRRRGRIGDGDGNR